MKRKDQVAEYEEMREVDAIIQECASCGQSLPRYAMDRHHPCGKHGANILKYVYLCRPCHSAAHENPALATKRGLLWKLRNIREITDGEWADLLAKMKRNRLIL